MICGQSVRFVINPCMQGRLELMWPMVWVMMPKVVKVYVSLWHHWVYDVGWVCIVLCCGHI